MHAVKFKYKNLHTAALLEYLFKFDLKSSYHHVDIHPKHFQFLGFQMLGSKRQVLLLCVFSPPIWVMHSLFTNLMRPGQGQLCIWTIGL